MGQKHYREVSSSRGVTLIELLVVLAIIGIIALFALVDFQWYARDSRLSESRDYLLSMLEETKLRAISGVPYGVAITGTSFKMIKLNDINLDFIKNSTETAADVANTSYTVPSGMTLSGPANNELWFDRKGIPRRTDTWALNATTFTLWYDKNGNGTPDSNEQAKTVVVSTDGRIKYEQ